MRYIGALRGEQRRKAAEPRGARVGTALHSPGIAGAMSRGGASVGNVVPKCEMGRIER